MESHEIDFDKQKDLLEQDKDMFARSVESELQLLAGNVKKVSTGLLLAVGGIALVYLLSRKLFFRNKVKLKKFKESPTQLMVKQPQQESEMVRMIKEQIAIFIIGIIKEKLLSFIKTVEPKK